MARQKTTEPEQVLRGAALRYPETEEGTACKGTALETSTFKARDKAFLFMSARDGSYNVKVKLRESQAEAAGLAAKQPGRFKIGSSGWATVTFSGDESPPLDLLERWIDESYRVIASKQLVAMLPERGPPPAKKKPASR